MSVPTSRSTSSESAGRATRTRPTALRCAALIGSVLAVVLTVGGCGAGPNAQTSQEAPAVNGAAATTGPIAVRDAMIVLPARPAGPDAYAPGGTAPLRMWIVNQGQQPDRLLSASSSAATSVSTGGDLTVAPGGAVAVTAASSTASAAPVASPTGSTGEQVRHASMALVGLREAVQPGQNYPVTLVFENAGPITLAVPVGSTTQG